MCGSFFLFPLAIYKKPDDVQVQRKLKKSSAQVADSKFKALSFYALKRLRTGNTESSVCLNDNKGDGRNFSRSNKGVNVCL